MIGAGNIWSGSKLLAWLTAPTELAFSKGNMKDHYPIIWLHTSYADVEAAYQTIKRSYMTALSTDQLYDLMTKLLVVRFETYPKMLSLLMELGGTDFLANCEHRVNNTAAWEGKGHNSGYVRCLINAVEQLAEREQDTQCIALIRNGKGPRCRNKRKDDKHLCGPHLDLLIRKHTITVTPDCGYEEADCLFLTPLYDDVRVAAGGLTAKEMQAHGLS